MTLCGRVTRVRGLAGADVVDRLLRRSVRNMSCNGDEIFHGDPPSLSGPQQLHRSPPTDKGVGYLLGAGVSVGQAGQVATDEPSQLPVASDLARAGIVDRYLTRPRSSRRRVPLSLTR
jgi:hypothetical protein